MQYFNISSTQNSHVKNLVKLRDRKHRDRQKKILVEGYRELKHLVESNYDLLSLYYCSSFFKSKNSFELIDKIKESSNLNVFEMNESAFQKCSLRENPDGLIGISKPEEFNINKISTQSKTTILIIEGIEKPGNLGAIIRSADGSGVSAVILNDCIIDHYNHNVIRTSQGIVFRVPILKLEKNEIINWLNQNNFQTIATAPNAIKCYSEIKYSNKTAIILGSESKGLSNFFLNKIDEKIKIPMNGFADSLNVSTAAAICLYEINRQKNIN